MLMALACAIQFSPVGENYQISIIASLEYWAEINP